MEMARNRNDLDEQRRIVAEMQSRFPQSSWLAEALYDTGNTVPACGASIRRRLSINSDLATRFPDSKHASAAHWKAGWLSYPARALHRGGAPLRRADSALSHYPGSGERPVLARTLV